MINERGTEKNDNKDKNIQKDSEIRTSAPEFALRIG